MRAQGRSHNLMLIGKNKRKMGKKALCLIFAFLLSINSFAAVVSDNDGSAFITKAEYDSLKNNFQSQLDSYNTGIDSKIDNAISSYLAGIKTSKSGTIDSLKKGVIWSIGPFDRPRFKHGVPIWDMMSGRIFFPTAADTRSGKDLSTYINMVSSWGDNFTNKTPIVNSRWGYDDILLTKTSSTGALLDGWYGLCGHWKQIWYVTNMQPTWADGLTNTSVSAAISGVSSQNLNGEFWSGNFRPQTTAKADTSWPAVQWVGNPFLSIGTGNGNINYSTISKGNQLKWDTNLSVFAPITYNCFAEEYNNIPADPNDCLYNIRDEICYITLSSLHCSETRNNDWNLLRYTMPDPDYMTTPSENPWNLSSLPGAINQFRYAYHRKLSDTNYTLLNSNVPLYATRSYLGKYTYGGTTWTFKQHMYIQEPKLLTSITNWNKIGLDMEPDVKTYINNNSLTSQLLTLSDKTKALSLAAGVPISKLEKKKKMTIKGEFRKNCSYDYNATTKKSVLNEGSLDDTDAYIIYAKYTPFNINTMPENETDLIDISPSTKDAANIGKLAKCRIVRDGKINITFTNDEEKDKLIFFKWEKLSNWTTPGTTRKTGAGTNTDVHKTNTLTGETVAPPTWTYFGGGFAKFEDKFSWQDID